MMTAYDHDMVAQIIKENQMLKSQLAQAKKNHKDIEERAVLPDYSTSKSTISRPDESLSNHSTYSIGKSRHQEHEPCFDIKLNSDILSYKIEVSSGIVLHLPESVQFGTKHKLCVIFSARNTNTSTIAWGFAKSYTQLRFFDERIRKVLAPLIKAGSIKLKTLPPKEMFIHPTPWKVDVRNDMINTYFSVMLSTLTVKSFRGSVEMHRQIGKILTEFMLQDVLDYSRLSNLGSEGSAESTPLMMRSRAQGCLITRSEINSEWQCIFGFINGEYLNIIEDVNGNALCKAILLKDAQVRSIVVFFDATEDDARYLFEISEKTGKKHFFTAESEKDRQRWIECINMRIQLIDKNEVISLPQSKKVKEYLPLFVIRGSFRARIKGQNKVSDSLPAAPEPCHHFKDPSLSSIKSSGSSGLSRYSLYEEMNNEKGSLASQGGIFDGDEFYMQISKPDTNSVNKLDGLMFGIHPVNCKYQLAILKTMNVPSLVARCVQCIIQPENLIEKGIFRISGSLKLIHDLQDQFDSLGDLNLVNAQVDVHTAADLLKRYLRSLPSNYFGKWSEARAKYALELDEYAQREYLASQIHQLQKMNRNILFTVLFLLQKIVEHQDQNNMNAQNLGLALSPALGMPAPMVRLLIFHKTCTEFDFQ